MIELLHYEFVQNAFLAGTTIAVICGLVGYFVILRGQAFSSESLSHVGFTGATGSALVGISSLLGMLFLTLLGAFGIGALGRRMRGRDIEIGMVLTFFLGLGVLFLNLYSSNPIRAVGVLFGSILSISRQDVFLSVCVGGIVLVVLAVIFRPLLFASIDPEIAEARGVPVRTLSILFTLLLAVTVSEAIQIVGVLLVFAMLVVPAATAEILTHHPLSTLLSSLILNILTTWVGLILAFISNAPVSFCMVGLMTLLYFAARIFRHVRSPRRYQPFPHPSREIDQNRTTSDR